MWHRLLAYHDPIFDSKHILQRFCKFTFEYRWSALWNRWPVPCFLAVPVNGGLAARYNSALLPEKGNILNYWIRISKPVFRKMWFPILLQTGFAAYLGSRQYKLLIKALQLPEPGLEIEWLLTKSVHKNKTIKITYIWLWINRDLYIRYISGIYSIQHCPLR